MNEMIFFAGLVSSVAILPEVIGFCDYCWCSAAVFASAVTLLVITLRAAVVRQCFGVCWLNGLSPWA